MRLSKDPNERRQEILDTAKKLFFTNGIDNTSVSQIVKTIGVAQGLFYYYFRTKDDVIRAVIDEELHVFSSELHAKLNACRNGFYEKLATLVNAYFKMYTQKNLEEAQVLRENSAYQAVRERAMEVSQSLLSGVIDEGVEKGLVTSKYSDLMLQITLEGISSVSGRKDISKEMLAVIVEQSLGLQKGKLAGAIEDDT